MRYIILLVLLMAFGCKSLINKEMSESLDQRYYETICKKWLPNYHYSLFEEYLRDKLIIIKKMDKGILEVNNIQAVYSIKWRHVADDYYHTGYFIIDGKGEGIAISNESDALNFLNNKERSIQDFTGVMSLIRDFTLLTNSSLFYESTYLEEPLVRQYDFLNSFSIKKDKKKWLVDFSLVHEDMLWGRLYNIEISQDAKISIKKRREQTISLVY